MSTEQNLRIVNEDLKDKLKRAIYAVEQYEKALRYLKRHKDADLDRVLKLYGIEVE